MLGQIANTGNLTGTSQDLVNIETAAVFGPLTLQAEYTANWITNAAQAPPLNGVPAAGSVGTFFGQGAYVQALFFLTGEHRTWDRGNASFNRVIPNEPFFWLPGGGGQCGLGAWELAIRYAYLDLTNKGINGGVLNDTTVGLNWYLNPNAKFQFNYDALTRAATGGGHRSDLIQAAGARLAFDF